MDPQQAASKPILPFSNPAGSRSGKPIPSTDFNQEAAEYRLKATPGQSGNFLRWTTFIYFL